MDLLSVSNNKPGQSYGQDTSVAVRPGFVYLATVEKVLGDDLYLLSINKQTLEARVATELEVGSSYHMVVEKPGTPPELSVVNDTPTSRDPAAKLTAEEERFVDKVLSFRSEEGKSGGEALNKEELLAFIRSAGYNIDDDPREVYTFLKTILPQLEQMDMAPPQVRQSLAQTLIYNFQHQLFGADGKLSNLSQVSFENAIQLSGIIPDFGADDLQILSHLMGELESLAPDRRQQMLQLLLGLGREPGAEAKLNESLALLIARMETIPGEATGKEGEAHLIAALQKAELILGDPAQRFLLGSVEIKSSLQEASIPGFADRQAAIQAFQNQAPSLRSGSISSLLDQFVTLGGRLEQLSVRDVLASQQAWQGQTPSAMQVHRTASLLYLMQSLPPEARTMSQSPLLARGDEEILPTFLSRKIVVDPVNASVYTSRIKAFSSSIKLPSSLLVDRFLQNWVQQGNILADLRPHISSIQAWNSFIEAHPEMRNQLTAYLFQKPIFSGETNLFPMQDSTVNILPETSAGLSQALEETGLDLRGISNKYLHGVAAALQEVAGENTIPSASLIETGAWMAARNMEVTPASLRALYQFQNGHQEVGSFLKTLGEMRQLLDQLPSETRNELSKAMTNLPSEGRSLKETIEFYQSGNGSKLRQVLQSLREHLLAAPGRESAHVLRWVGNMTQALESQELFLTGLKQYNAQATRQDTPLLYELPFAFGESMEKALLKIFQRNSGAPNAGQDSFKVVIDLNLEALGNLRSEITLQKGAMHLDFQTQDASGLEALKKNASLLSERLEERNLTPTLAFHLRQPSVDPNSEPALPGAISGRNSRLKIDVSA
ncbi:MAG: flagellar hook-length control protein FliK [Planctomycetes bacterium]|nr:flagellar hook-length control protein FliK [Planctomycetota bacterium]